MANRRTKQKAPVLFGARMRRILLVDDVATHWERRFGSVPARIDRIDYLKLPWRFSWGKANGYCRTQAAAELRLEALIRRTVLAVERAEVSRG